jgi:hypothetical protein
VDALFTSLYVQYDRMPFTNYSTYSLEVHSRGPSPPLLKPLRSYYLTCQLPLFYVDRGKKSSQALPDVW